MARMLIIRGLAPQGFHQAESAILNDTKSSKKSLLTHMDRSHALFDGLFCRNRKGCIIKLTGSRVYRIGRSGANSTAIQPRSQDHSPIKKDGG